jgi:hypothetical protein
MWSALLLRSGGEIVEANEARIEARRCWNQYLTEEQRQDIRELNRVLATDRVIRLAEFRELREEH